MNYIDLRSHNVAEGAALAVLLEELRAHYMPSMIKHERDELRELVAGTVIDECPECDGSGEGRDWEDNDTGPVAKTCPTCLGVGMVRWVLVPEPLREDDKQLNDADIPF